MCQNKITLDKNKEDIATICKCCSKHVPLPLYYYEISGEIVCPTTYYNVEHLLVEYAGHGGVPPGSIRKHYSKFVQRLALQEWAKKELR